MTNFSTDQESFWVNTFGDEYISRNEGKQVLANNLSFFSKALKRAEKINSCIEFGSNVGLNLKGLELLYPNIHLEGIEINKNAHSKLSEIVGEKNAHHLSILEFEPKKTFDLSLIKGVLIHINPEKLPLVYDKLYEASHRYILISEYYNPKPVSVTYRGHKDKLFKRDFAGEFMDRFKDVHLVDYGFCYHRDPAFAIDDTTWFLLKKDGIKP